MKILMLPCDYLPHSVGGREVYAHGLARCLIARGFNVRVAFHVCYGRPEPGFYTHEEVPVFALPPLPEPRREEVYACRPHAVPGYRELLEEFKPDIVHMHDFSYGVSLTHLELARQMGGRTVVDYASPGQSCLQRSLLYKGQTPCDGRIDLQRCTECRLQCNGVPAPLARLMGALDLSFLARFAPDPVQRLMTVRRMTAHFQETWDLFCQQVDIIHVFANWCRDLFLINGAPGHKIRMYRSGLAYSDKNRAPNGAFWKQARDDTLLRAVYMGRLDPVKGVGTLVEAVRRLPRTLKIEVLIIGGGSRDQEAFRRTLEERAEGDKRLTFCGRLSPDQIVSTARTADVSVIPSLWLETGPMTLWEAWAAGLPVIGSKLGGISEVVRDGIDGLLFPPGDAAALSRVLHDLAMNRAKLERLCEGIPRPRTMEDVCENTIDLYREVVG